MATSAANTPEDQVRSIHQYKITPPISDGDFSNFEEWKYKFTAYIGLINPIFPRLLQQTERSTDAISDQTHYSKQEQTPSRKEKHGSGWQQNFSSSW